ncbi:hypothetical protein [Mycolicibacterium sp.]|uniref:hypothetical protein n=1 Tax=Mycolicibacterium sp. TaxID=2320850 RepID=UPI0037CB5A00
MNATYNNGQIRITIDPVEAVITRSWEPAPGEFRVEGQFTCDRETAADIGVTLLRYSGSESSWGSQRWTSSNATLDVIAEDGSIILVVNGSNSGDALDDTDVVDLARRLIVFGGFPHAGK